MRLKLFLLFVCILCSIISFGQSRNPDGLYNGFFSTRAGYFYFKKDSTFIFCSSPLTNRQPYKEGVWNFSDTITSIGKGKWQVNKTTFRISFNKFEGQLITNNKVTYNSSSKMPYDSLILKVKCVNKENKPIDYFSVVFDKINKVGTADGSGNFEIVANPRYADLKITIMKAGYERQAIYLSTGNNYHEFELILSEESNYKFSLIEYESKSYKIENANGFFKTMPFIKDNGGKTKLEQLIVKNIEKFPERKFVLTKLLEELSR